MSIELHPRVLELMASRICHDLVSPVGAISNGMELLQELGEDAGKEAVALISDSAQQAAARLKCFRLAYGAAGTDKTIGFREVREVFSAWLKAGGRVQAEFAADLDNKFPLPPRGFFKCALNAMIFAEECSRGEGKIHVEALDDGRGLKILAVGQHAGLREGAAAAFRGETAPDDLDSRAIHAYITGRFAAYFGLRAALKAEPDFGRLEIHLAF